MNPTRVSSPQRLAVRFLGAYLAKVSCSGNVEVVVALCLPDDTPNQPAVVRDAAAVFAELFSVDQHLDVVFVSAEDEKRLTRVCKPFFSGP